MLSLHFTSHASARMLQRGFSESLVLAIVRYGDSRVSDLEALKYTVSSASLQDAPLGTFSNSDIGKTVVLSRHPRSDGSFAVITIFKAPPPPAPHVRFTAYDRRQRSRYHRRSRGC